MSYILYYKIFYRSLSHHLLTGGGGLRGGIDGALELESDKYM